MKLANALTDEQKAWLDLSKIKPVKFGIDAGFTDLGEMHNEWIRSFVHNRDDQTLQAHRGSYKTTSLSVAMGLMLILQPHRNIMFMRKTDDDVKEIISQTAKLLRTDLYRELAYVQYGVEVTLTKESVFEIGTNLDFSTSGAPQLLGIGAGGSLTGKHADIVITDDIVNMKDRYSKAERDKTKRIYQELENIKNRGGRYINTGTPWHKEDAFTLMPNLKKYDVHTTGLMTPKEIQDIREKMTTSLFAANYELKHIADEDSMFASPTIDEGERTHLIYNGVCHIDAAYGGDDYTAFTIMREDRKTNKIYAYGKMWQKHVDDVLPTIEDLRKHYRAGTLYNETNADKGYLNKNVERPRKGYHESMNKYVRISTYLRKNWSRIVWISDTDPDYLTQILDYTENAENDDAPDSAASLIKEAIDNKKSGWMI